MICGFSKTPARAPPVVAASSTSVARIAYQTLQHIRDDTFVQQLRAPCYTIRFVSTGRVVGTEGDRNQNLNASRTNALFPPPNASCMRDLRRVSLRSHIVSTQAETFSHSAFVSQIAFEVQRHDLLRHGASNDLVQTRMVYLVNVRHLHLCVGCLMFVVVFFVIEIVRALCLRAPLATLGRSFMDSTSNGTFRATRLGVEPYEICS